MGHAWDESRGDQRDLWSFPASVPSGILDGAGGATHSRSGWYGTSEEDGFMRAQLGGVMVVAVAAPLAFGGAASARELEPGDDHGGFGLGLEQVTVPIALPPFDDHGGQGFDDGVNHG
jgi:hypothetical protein